MPNKLANNIRIMPCIVASSFRAGANADENAIFVIPSGISDFARPLSAPLSWYKQKLGSYLQMINSMCHTYEDDVYKYVTKEEKHRDRNFN